MKMYTISKGHDQISGKEYWYCHMKGYSYVPVFGSIGNKAHAKKYADMMNKSNGKSWKQQ
jgi:hypothetical protein